MNPIPQMPVQDATSSLKILVTNARLSVTSATSWSQFWTPKKHRGLFQVLGSLGFLEVFGFLGESLLEHSRQLEWMQRDDHLTYFSKWSVLTSLIAFQYRLNVIQQTQRRTEKPKCNKCMMSCVIIITITIITTITTITITITITIINNYSLKSR